MIFTLGAMLLIAQLAFWTLARGGLPQGAHLCRVVSLGTCWRCQARLQPGAGTGGSLGVPCMLPGKGPFPPAGCAGLWLLGMLGRTGGEIHGGRYLPSLQHRSGPDFLPVPRTDMCGVHLNLPSGLPSSSWPWTQLLSQGYSSFLVILTQLRYHLLWEAFLGLGPSFSE